MIYGEKNNANRVKEIKMRKTKIVCTLGPATDGEETLSALCLAGMNVARLNFSHGEHADHKKRMDEVKKVRRKLNLPVAILLDTKGPEYRIGTFRTGRITLKAGDRFTFTARQVQGDEKCVSVSYPALVKELSAGDMILLNNGLLSFRVERIAGEDIECVTVIGGELSDRKSMSFPGHVMHREYLSEQDKKDILFGAAEGVDFIACSFVSRAQDLIDVRDLLAENGISGIGLIAKIENQSGVDHIDEICEYCDGIMVARGDMGVEIPFERLPALQKKLIAECRMIGKRVITATEMLESMIQSPRPTRAEISDVANAVYDGTSAVMLSGETAVGKNPVTAVEVMARIVETAEADIDYERRFHDAAFRIKNTTDAISHATCGMAIDIGARAIVACSLSGITVRMISRFRVPVPIIGLTTDEKKWRSLALSWGVLPVLTEKVASTDALLRAARRVATETLPLEKGDRIVVTAGDIRESGAGNTDLIKVEEI